jgi:RecA/RadA recombinase
MSFSFRPARREGVPLLIGLAGASGSGKTFSALSLAQGIASVTGGKIAFIDTERRRGLHYADRFDFMHAELDPPFTPGRYAEAFEAAEQAGASVVVVDSASAMNMRAKAGSSIGRPRKRSAARNRRRNGSSPSPRTRAWSITCSAPSRTSSFACAPKRRC